MGYPVSVCKSCGAPVVWAIAKSGNKMPVDPAVLPGGNIELTEVNGQVFAEVLTAAGQAKKHDVLRRSHFSTCPGAATHRKPRPKKGAGPSLFGAGLTDRHPD